MTANKENSFFAGVKSYFNYARTNTTTIITIIAAATVGATFAGAGGIIVAGAIFAAVGASAIGTGIAHAINASSKKKSRKYIAGITTAAILTTGAFALAAVESLNSANNNSLKEKSEITTSFNHAANQNQKIKTSNSHILKAPALFSKFN